MKNEVVNKKVLEHLGDFVAKYPKMEYVGMFLQGSQNYGLDYKDSDVDTKIIVLPSFEDFVRVKSPISHTFVRDNNEHIDLKDIRNIVEVIKKQNINFVEILFTDYSVLNPKYEAIFKKLIDNRERIARYNVYGAISCMVGMSLEKYKAMEHPYPSVAPKIEKFGYDAKQLHHIIRMREFIERYIDGESYKDCLQSNQREYLIEVKKGFHSLQEARNIAENMTKEIREIRDKYMNENPNNIDHDVEMIMNEVVVDILKLYFREQLLK